jgi:hypothetical protein
MSRRSGEDHASSPNYVREKVTLSLGKFVRFSKVKEHTFTELTVVREERIELRRRGLLPSGSAGAIVSVLLHLLFGGPPPTPPSS